MGRGDPGLAGAGGPEHDDLGAGAQRVEVGGLGGIQRLDRRKSAFDLELGSLEFYDLSRLIDRTLRRRFLLKCLLLKCLPKARLLLLSQEEWSRAVAPRGSAA